MKSKPRFLDLIVLVFLLQTRPAHPKFVKEELKNIVLERKSLVPYDYFTLNMKVSHRCSSSCSSAKAALDTSKGNSSSCSCICWPPRYSFRSSDLQCTGVSQAKGFGGKRWNRPTVLKTKLSYVLNPKNQTNKETNLFQPFCCVVSFFRANVLVSYVQGCTVAEPGVPWCPTFALGGWENLGFVIQIICCRATQKFVSTQFALWKGVIEGYCNTMRKIGKYRNTIPKLKSMKYRYCIYDWSHLLKAVWSISHGCLRQACMHRKIARKHQKSLSGTMIEKPDHWMPFQFRHRLCNHLPLNVLKLVVISD